MLSQGDKVRDYEIIAPIRSGGMAMLYLSRRRGMGGFSRLVALKLVHSHWTDDPDVNRSFLEEARIAASVAHPNVVHVEEVGRADGKYFIAMEYVHGVSLDQLLTSLSKRNLRMSPKLCIWVAAQVSEALHAVHEATGENGAPLNIVHRDVSPQNVLIGHTGHVKLIDFGIAKSQLMSQQVSHQGSVIGKLRYMAPEQLRRQPVGRRADVYALGVMLWEMLASRNLLRCFRIDDERDWLTRENPPAPSKHAPDVTPAIDYVVLKAIASDPDARYESALAFRAALLRAEPSASRVDAPMFAALLHNVLGEELERRRANWPTEVNVQLDSNVVSDTGRTPNLEELTRRIESHDAPISSEDEELDEPTSIQSPYGLRGDDSRGESADPETVVERRIGAGPLPRQPSIEAQIDTFGAPASTAKPRASLGCRLRQLARRADVVGTVSFAFLFALLALASGLVPKLHRYLVGAEPPRSTSLAQPAPRSIEPPLKLEETRIVSPAEAQAVKENTPRVQSLPAPTMKRAFSRPMRKNPKLTVSYRKRPLRRR